MSQGLRGVLGAFRFLDFLVLACKKKAGGVFVVSFGVLEEG